MREGSHTAFPGGDFLDCRSRPPSRLLVVGSEPAKVPDPENQEKVRVRVRASSTVPHRKTCTVNYEYQ